MYCWPSALGLWAGHYLSNLQLSWVSTRIDFNFGIVYYEVVYIIVRYDVCDHLLVFLAIWTLPLILISFHLCHLLGPFGCYRSLVYDFCAFVWILLKTFTDTSVVIWRRWLIIEVQDFCFRGFSHLLRARWLLALIHFSEWVSVWNIILIIWGTCHQLLGWKWWF